jgi:1-acyl-sn-glycerol-3-phosphate acyltransferase
MIFKKIKGVFIFIQFVITVFFVIVLMKLFNKNHWYFRRKWAKMQPLLVGYKLHIYGKPDKRAKMVLMNHQSMLDIIIMEAEYPGNVAWVAKKEIADMKFYGNILKLPKMIIIDRDDRKSLVQLFKESRERISEGRVIALFPEGTRGDGKELLDFKIGAKMIAKKLDIIVQPIVIANTREVLDSQDFLAQSGEVSLTYLDAIDPKEDSEWFENLKPKMQEVLDKELEKLSKNS